MLGGAHRHTLRALLGPASGHGAGLPRRDDGLAERRETVLTTGGDLTPSPPNPYEQFLVRLIPHVGEKVALLREELGPLKTEASYRSVPAPARSATPSPPTSQSSLRPPGLVFTNERDAPIQQFPFSQVWETAKTKARLPEWATPHDLRHHYASVLIRGGLSVKVVQARLGHSSAKTMLDLYAHLFPDEEDRTKRAVDEAFAVTPTAETAMSG